MGRRAGDHHYCRTPRAQSRVLDRVVVKLSLAMLARARTRAEREFIGRDQHSRMVATATETRRREHHFAQRAARVI